MGDRGNIVVDGVWMYTHWDGHGIKNVLKDALQRGVGRWDDGPYLARIVFCQLIKGEKWDDTTGYGLSTSMQDNNNPILFVEPETRMVYEVEEKHVERHKDYDPEKAMNKWSFDDFVEQEFDED